MKMKALTAFLFLIVTSTQVLAARPSIGGLDAKLDTLINDLVACSSNSPTRFVDNGDGTICDHQTGLMWEKKNAADGTRDLNNPHDVDNIYTWKNTADGDDTNPDGTAFTEFLARLNGEIAGSRPSEQLAGYSDWRLPTSAELQTILDCNFSPCINPVFGPTAASVYWSSTSRANSPNSAWGVFFDDGFVVSGGKSSDGHVRAVRGGL